GHADRAIDSRAERRHFLQRIPREGFRRRARPCGGLVHAAVDRRTIGVCATTQPVRGIVSYVLQLTVFRPDVPTGIARATTLRRDLNDTVRRCSTVQCCRGRALQNLDALDLLRADVVQPRDALATEAEGERLWIVVYLDAVNDQQRLVGERDAGLPANTYTRSRARGTGALHHGHACGATLQQLRHRRDRSQVDVLDCDRCHGAADLAATLLTGRGNDQPLERHGTRAELEIRRRSSACRNRDGSAGAAVADQLCLDTLLTRRYASQDVTALSIAQRVSIGAGDEDLHAAKRPAGRLVRHLTRDGPGGLGLQRRVRRCDQQSSHDQRD